MNTNQDYRIISVGQVKTENRKADSLPNRKFFTIAVRDFENPFASAISRNIWQQHVTDKETGEVKAIWKAVTPEQASLLVDKQMPGLRIVSVVDLPPITRTILNRDVVVTKQNVIAFKHETDEEVTKAITLARTAEIKKLNEGTTNNEIHNEEVPANEIESITQQ